MLPARDVSASSDGRTTGLSFLRESRMNFSAIRFPTPKVRETLRLNRDGAGGSTWISVQRHYGRPWLPPPNHIHFGCWVRIAKWCAPCRAVNSKCRLFPTALYKSLVSMIGAVGQDWTETLPAPGRKRPKLCVQRHPRPEKRRRGRL